MTPASLRNERKTAMLKTLAAVIAVIGIRIPRARIAQADAGDNSQGVSRDGTPIDMHHGRRTQTRGRLPTVKSEADWASMYGL
jgi:hypothetical protein